MRLNFKKPKPCPYCLEYNKELYECDGCGAVLCAKCSVIFADESMCTDCTARYILPHSSKHKVPYDY
jgi:hypothetical protein